MSTMVQIMSAPEETQLSRNEPVHKPLKSTNQRKKLNKAASQQREQKTLTRKGPSAKELEYAQELTAYIEKNRFYPKKAWRLKKQGTVVISLTILNNGDFTDISLVETSNHPILDSSALSFLADLKKFKPLPGSNLKKRDYIVPIFYKIGR